MVSNLPVWFAFQFLKSFLQCLNSIFEGFIRTQIGGLPSALHIFISVTYQFFWFFSVRSELFALAWKLRLRTFLSYRLESCFHGLHHGLWQMEHAFLVRSLCFPALPRCLCRCPLAQFAAPTTFRISIGEAPCSGLLY